MGRLVYMSYYDLLFNAVVEAKAPKIGYRRAEQYARKRLRELRVSRLAGRSEEGRGKS